MVHADCRCPCLQVLKVSFREPSNRQVLRKADIATLMEHLRLQMAPSVVSECAMVLLNSCFEPLNALHLAELDSLSTFCGILDGQHDVGQQAAVTGIIQSICLQVMSQVDLPCLTCYIIAINHKHQHLFVIMCVDTDNSNHAQGQSMGIQGCWPHQTPSLIITHYAVRSTVLQVHHRIPKSEAVCPASTAAGQRKTGSEEQQHCSSTPVSAQGWQPERASGSSGRSGQPVVRATIRAPHPAKRWHPSSCALPGVCSHACLCSTTARLHPAARVSINGPCHPPQGTAYGLPKAEIEAVSHHDSTAWPLAGLTGAMGQRQLQLQSGTCRVKLLAVSLSGRLEQWKAWFACWGAATYMCAHMSLLGQECGLVLCTDTFEKV